MAKAEDALTFTACDRVELDRVGSSQAKPIYTDCICIAEMDNTNDTK
jgi:hypothetical protein